MDDIICIVMSASWLFPSKKRRKKPNELIEFWSYLEWESPIHSLFFLMMLMILKFTQAVVKRLLPTPLPPPEWSTPFPEPAGRASFHRAVVHEPWDQKIWIKNGSGVDAEITSNTDTSTKHERFLSFFFFLFLISYASSISFDVISWRDERTCFMFPSIFSSLPYDTDSRKASSTSANVRRTTSEDPANKGAVWWTFTITKPDVGYSFFDFSSFSFFFLQVLL